MTNESSTNSTSNSNTNQRRRHSVSGQRRQGIYWLGTIARESGWQPCLPKGISWICGQLEKGDGGFEHYQVCFSTSKKTSLAAVVTLWHPIIGHWELSRSTAAEQYCTKLESRIAEPFEYGRKPIKRQSITDWDLVRSQATAGEFEQIPSDIFVRFYSSLCKIRSDYLQPLAVERSCNVFWGKTGTGKSKTAWEHAGLDAYAKDPRTKFWCGYRSQQCVIIDEFRGSIDISHLLRWLDRYPVRVELKGSSTPLMATTFWITSNIHPNQWYPELDQETYLALERRLVIKEF